MPQSKQHADQQVADQEWPDESWAARTPRCPEEAAYMAGRLLNCLPFHGEQELMLAYWGPRDLVDRQRSLVSKAFRALRMASLGLASPDRENCEELIDEAWRSWSEWEWREELVELFAHYNREPQSSYEGVSEDRRERCKELVHHIPKKMYADIAEEFFQGLPESLRMFAEIGLRVDRLLRPESVHLLLWIEPPHWWEVQPSSSVDSPAIWLRQAAKNSSASPPENTLANIARRAGELAPDPGWEPALSALLCKVNISATLPSELRDEGLVHEATAGQRRSWASQLDKLVGR